MARAPTSNQDRRAQERVTEIGRRAPAAARAARRPPRGRASPGARPRPPGKGPPKGRGGIAPSAAQALSMRIVGGRLKGRTLLTPSSRAIRPTSERLRELMFDILEHRFPGRIEGARVVDLFAGTGALAIEALSRGARFALFVDGWEARALLRANVEALALGGVTRIWRADAAKLGAAPAVSSLFALPFSIRPMHTASPPPRSPPSSKAAGSKLPALCVVEEAAKAEIAAPSGLALADERTYGDTRIAIFFLRGRPARGGRRDFDFFTPHCQTAWLAPTSAPSSLGGRQ